MQPRKDRILRTLHPRPSLVVAVAPVHVALPVAGGVNVRDTVEAEGYRRPIMGEEPEFAKRVNVTHAVHPRVPGCVSPTYS